MKPKYLLILGLILTGVGVVWFFRSLGLGGGFGSVLVLLIGLGCCVATLLVYLPHENR